MTESRLREQAKAAGKSEEISEADVLAAMPPLERHIFDVSQAKLLDGYIVFEIIGQKCPRYMSLADDITKKQVEDYIRKYVILAKE